MKRIVFVKRSAAICFCVAFIITMLINNFGLAIFTDSDNGVYDHRNAWFNEQTANILPESTGVKVQLKPIDVSFADKFFSSEYCKDRLSKYPKIFIIISETLSEINIRNSSFLISEFTTDT